MNTTADTMNIFVAGATGVIGQRLVPLLVARGHAVTGMTRSPERAEAVRAAGAEPVVADALDRDAVTAAVERARPHVVVHMLTALSQLRDLRRIDRTFELTNRLRTEGTDHLVAAARAAGARRLVAHSYAGWPYAREGGPVKTEDDPLDPDPPGGLKPLLDAIRHLERAVVEADGLDGLVLRCGAFYGPGTGLARGGGQAEAVRRRRFPVIGGGGGVWSFVHVDDVAAATAAAVERGAPGIYNVVDDDPAPVAEWLPALAEAAGGPPPRRAPRWLGRLALGSHGVAMMTEVRGASNAKARRELGWEPAHPSWRQGFAQAL
jgi:2-alkyl-3-oxoalkanoate reductase